MVGSWRSFLVYIAAILCYEPVLAQPLGFIHGFASAIEQSAVQRTVSIPNFRYAVFVLKFRVAFFTGHQVKLFHLCMLKLLAYVLLAAYNDKRMADSLSMAISPENIKSSHDVFISLFGELKIHTSHGVLPESDLKSPKISRLLTFMLLSNKKALSSLEIVQEIWPEELEDKDEPGKKVKQLVYRLRQAFSIISDEQLILSTPSGYQFNPDLHITTDFQRFDELCIAAAKATSAINKVRLLEKAASLYQGKLLSAANGEHWLVHYANRYHLAFMSTVNELLKQLMDFHAYDLLHRDAALALTIAPENTKAYYWLIRSYQKQHMDEMAAGELAAAKQKLPEDEYQKLLNSLER